VNEKREQELISRLNHNFADYQDKMMALDKREIFDMAWEVSSMCDCHYYLTDSHEYEDSEIEYLLLFQNPLELVSQKWDERQEDISDMTFALDALFSKEPSEHRGHALMSDLKPPGDPNGPHRFMGVNLIDFLGKIAKQVIVHYPNDWSIDIKELYRAAKSDNPEDKQLMWHVSSFGTHLLPERDVFIKDSGKYEYWVDYRQDDPDMFGYAIEVTRTDGLFIEGNVFEVGNYAQHAKHVRETALPLDSVTLTYSDAWGVNAGKTITVPRCEYDDDRHRLRSKSGNVIATYVHPADENKLAGILHRERAHRMTFHNGSQREHLAKLSGIIAAVRVQREAERLMERFQSEARTAPADQKKLRVPLSHEFMMSASSADHSKLFDLIPFKSLQLSNVTGEKGVFAFIARGENLDQSLRTPKASIGDRLAQANEKAREQQKPQIQSRKRDETALS